MHHQPPNAVDLCRALRPEDLVNWLTEERFFEQLSDATKLKFVAAEIHGETFMERCWDVEFNSGRIGLPIGPADRLASKVLQIYRNAGMSSVLMLLSTSY
jgi:hypothetical protein